MHIDTSGRHCKKYFLYGEDNVRSLCCVSARPLQPDIQLDSSDCAQRGTKPGHGGAKSGEKWPCEFDAGWGIYKRASVFMPTTIRSDGRYYSARRLIKAFAHHLAPQHYQFARPVAVHLQQISIHLQSHSTRFDELKPFSRLRQEHPCDIQ